MKPLAYTRAQQLPAILDGAMGTMMQRFKLTEAQYRGERFKDFPRDVKRCAEGRWALTWCSLNSFVFRRKLHVQDGRWWPGAQERQVREP